MSTMDSIWDRLRPSLAGLAVALVLWGCANIGPVPTAPVRTAITQPGGYGSMRADWVGVWQGREPDISGYSDTVTVLKADGTFSTQSSNVEFGSLVTIWGQWDVFDLAGTPFLRFAVEGHEPREWCGPLGCTAITVPTGATRYFEFVTTNEVILRDQGCTDSQCEARYTRSI